MTTIENRRKAMVTLNHLIKVERRKKAIASRYNYGGRNAVAVCKAVGGQALKYRLAALEVWLKLREHN